MPLEPTPSQTVGPFFGFSLPHAGGERLVAENDRDTIHIEGHLVDGAGEPVPDGLIEIWQADRGGRFNHPDDDRRLPPPEEGFHGFGRCPTDLDGRFSFATVKPGSIGDGHAPHIDVAVHARGLLRHLVTRIYFPDEEAANAADPVLSSIEDPQARATLIAHDDGGVLRFDIRLQGDGETAFFDF